MRWLVRGRGPGGLEPMPAPSYWHTRAKRATAGRIAAHVALDSTPGPESSTTVRAPRQSMNSRAPAAR
jgi:hypothetical protein